MPAKAARRLAVESTAVIGISKTIGTAIIGLFCTLIGTGVIAQINLYVRVATMTESVSAVSETLKKHLADAVSERQYQRDQSAVYEQMRSMATKDEFRSLQRQIDNQTDVLHKIEDKLDHRR